jgi:hypothetical protein
MKKYLAATAVLTVLGGGVFIALRTPSSTPPATSNSSAHDPLNWIIAGGGGTPDQNQISIEDDILLAQRSFPGEGMTLFAGGPNTQGVQVSAKRDQDPLFQRLGDLFLPANRDTRFQPVRVVSVASATRKNILEKLSQGAQSEDGSLLFYFAGHGDMGVTPADNIISTWGNDVIAVRDFASTLDATQKRPVKVAMTSCFSGGFADMIFVGGEAERGLAPQTRCGVFASPWDLEAGGCDPDPVRGNHEGFGIHFLNALAGVNRDGSKIPVDTNSDGAVSLLEAYTQARIASKSMDVPTSTSERYLRHKLEGSLPSPALLSMPEEERVIAELLKRLGKKSVDEAAEEYALLQLKYSEFQDIGELAAAEETTAYREVAGQIFSKWPALSDPWHPDFRDTLDKNRAEIIAFLDTDPGYKNYLIISQKNIDTANEAAEIQVRSAPLERIIRAHETMRMAAQLKANDSESWKVFENIRACEAEPVRP